MREVVYRRLVIERDIPKLDAAVKIRIKVAIETKLALSPEIFGLPLRQSLKGFWKLRVGDYRIIFSLQKKQVEIVAILHRSQVYDAVLLRIVKK